jgi:hypothetical protein
MPGEYMANRLRILIEENQIKQIHIYRFTDSKLHQQSTEWSFGYEFLQVGNQSYNLNRVITFLVIDQVLELHF